MMRGFAALFLAVTCCTGVSAEELSEFRIGLMVPLTGGMAHVGAAFRDAALMAIEESAANGRYRYRLIIEDDGLKAAGAASAAHRLLDVEKADVLISTWSYGGIVAAPLAEKAERLHFGVAWDPAVAKGPHNLIYLTPPRRFVTKFFDAFQRKGYRRIATAGWNESGSLFFLDEVQRLAPANGFSVVKRTEFQGNETDYRSVLPAIAKSAPDVLLVNMTTPAIDVFVKQMKELQITLPITAITGFETALDLQQLEGMWYVSDATAPDAFAARFRERYGHEQMYGVGNYYDAVKLSLFLAERGLKPGRIGAEELRLALKHIAQFPSLFGKLDVDDEGIIGYEPVFRKVVNGKRRTVSADEL